MVNVERLVLTFSLFLTHDRSLLFLGALKFGTRLLHKSYVRQLMAGSGPHSNVRRLPTLFFFFSPDNFFWFASLSKPVCQRITLLSIIEGRLPSFVALVATSHGGCWSSRSEMIVLIEGRNRRSGGISVYSNCAELVGK